MRYPKNTRLDHALYANPANRFHIVNNIHRSFRNGQSGWPMWCGRH